MASNSLQEWEVYYKNEHKIYVDMKMHLSVETFVVMLLKMPEMSMGFKLVLRNLKNDLDFYSVHIIGPMYCDMKRLYNLYSDFPSLHKNMKMLLEANKFDANHVVMRLQENENGSLQFKIIYYNGMSEDILFIYPISMKTSYDIIYFLKREMEFEATMGKHHLMRSKIAEKELDKERTKNGQLVGELQVNADKIRELESRNERMWLENYQSRMQLVEIDESNKINYHRLLVAEDNINQLNRIIMELKAEQNANSLGIPNFARAVSSLSNDVESVLRTPMSRHQFLNMLDIFSTGVLELARVGTRLTRVMATQQEPNSMNMQFRSAVLSQTRLIAVMQDIWKGNRLTIDEASVIRKMIEGVTYEIVRKFGNNPAERRVDLGAGIRCVITATNLSEEDDGAAASAQVNATGTENESVNGSGPGVAPATFNSGASGIQEESRNEDVPESRNEDVPASRNEDVPESETARTSERRDVLAGFVPVRISGIGSGQFGQVRVYEFGTDDLPPFEPADDSGSEAADVPGFDPID